MAGHRVKWSEDERADLPDMDALQLLPYEALEYILGALLGPGSGAFTLPDFDASDPSGVVVGPCVLVGVSGDPANKWRLPRARIAVHDPTQPWQTASGIDLSVYAPSLALPYLWFRCPEKESDEATRMVYDEISQAEQPETPTTRWRRYVLFGVSTSRTTPPSGDEGWFPFAKVTGWNAGIPTIISISSWDFGEVPGTGGYQGTLVTNLFTTLATEVASHGLMHAIRALFLRGRRIVDSTFSYSQATGEVLNQGLGQQEPTRGGEQVHLALAAVEAKLAAQPVVLAHGEVAAAGTTAGSPLSFVGLNKYAQAQNDDEHTTTGYYIIRCRGLAKAAAPVFKSNNVGAGATPIAHFAVNITNDGTDSAIEIIIRDGANLADVAFYITIFGTVVP